MQFHIAEPNANLAIGAVWSNHSDSTKLIVLGGLDKLKDFILSHIDPGWTTVSKYNLYISMF